MQPGFQLEFPWNFYRFRDILNPNVSGENDTFPVDEVDESVWVRTLFFEEAVCACNINDFG